MNAIALASFIDIAISTATKIIWISNKNVMRFYDTRSVYTVHNTLYI